MACQGILGDGLRGNRKMNGPSIRRRSAYVLFGLIYLPFMYPFSKSDTRVVSIETSLVQSAEEAGIWT